MMVALRRLELKLQFKLAREKEEPAMQFHGNFAHYHDMGGTR